jgi:hypothetical protein
MSDGIGTTGRTPSRKTQGARAIGAAILLAAAAVCGPTLASDDVVLTEKGLGPLAAGTTLDLAKAGTVSERFSAEAFEAGSEGMAMPGVALANRKGVRVAEAVYAGEGGPLYRITVLRKAIPNERGHRVGDAFPDVVPAAEIAARCVAGAEEFSGAAVCFEGPGSSLAVVFAGRWDGPDGTLPPAEVLAGWKARALIWAAPRTGE